MENLEIYPELDDEMIEMMNLARRNEGQTDCL